jgi:large subunit ribosomal protein L13
VINAEKIGLTGRKLDQKMYYHHSNWPGGFKQETAKHLLQRKPTELMTEAVKGMLPKGPLGRKLLKKLKVYAGSEHPHQAQKPQTISE